MTARERRELEALSAHWRHAASLAGNSARFNALRVCADELDAVLAVAGHQREKPVTNVEGRHDPTHWTWRE